MLTLFEFFAHFEGPRAGMSVSGLMLHHDMDESLLWQAVESRRNTFQE